MTKMTKQIPYQQKVYQKWNVGQINLQTCSDDLKLDLTLQECIRANLDIVCFQEVRRLNTGSIHHLGYSFYWSGLQRLRKHGVAIAIRKCSYINIESIHNINARLIAADITVKGFKARIISCYAPTLQTSLTTKRLFYKELHALSKADGKRKVIVQGDFNAEFQISREHSCFDGSQSRIEEGTNQTNENCMLFLQYCQTNKLLILNTWFDHPIHHRVTWHHPNGRTKKVYDYSLSGSWLRRFIQDVRVRNSYFNSDHRLLVTKFLTPCNKAARYLKRGKKVIKPDLEQLQNDVIKENVISEINKYLEENDSPGSIDEMQSHLVNALHKGRQQIPKQTKSQQIIPWQHDQNLQMLNNQRTQLRKQNTTAQTTRELKQLNKQINKKTKEIRNKTFKAKGKELNSLKQQRQMTKLWKNAKQHSSIITRKPKPIQCPGLKTHFRKHFNPNQSNLQTPLEISNPPEYIQVLQDSNLQINNLPPSDEDISIALKQLNNGKMSRY